METQALLCLTLAFLFFSGAHSVTFTIKNNCPYTIWPGTLTGAGIPQLTVTGIELASGTSSAIEVPANWSGRMWARTLCSNANGKFTCGTADCASGQVACNGAGAVPPASLVEFTLGGSGGQDFYDVSLVDGFNLPVSITPQGAGCQSPSCPGNVNQVCPPDLAVKGSDGSVIACKSACEALSQPQYCCTGDFGTPDKCPPTQYSKIFKDRCPQAYSYAYDDKTSTFTCPTGANYLVTFCAHSATITITNNCSYTIWPGDLTANQNPQLSNTGFELASKASTSLDVPNPWTGRFWARTGCSTDGSGKFTCATADCGSGQVSCNGKSAVPPASLVEFGIALIDGQDFYDVSLVDGFNLPLSVAPQGGSGPCKSSSCPVDLNPTCPTDLQVLKASDGSVIGCKTACIAFNQPQYCCTGNYSSPETCPTTSYSQFFKERCPQAYSNAYDDQPSLFTCSGGPDYNIVFCP